MGFLTLISRVVGATICLGLMAVGAKHTGKALWQWKKAHDLNKRRITAVA